MYKIKSLDEYKDDELVFNEFGIKMTKKQFCDWYDKIEVPVEPCKNPDRDERIFKDKDFWEILLENSKELSEDEEFKKKFREVFGCFEN